MTRRLRDGLERLHDVFKDADTLGSLIDPKRTVADDGLMAVGWDEIQPLLTQALTAETTDDPAAAVFGAQVAGVAKAADLLVPHLHPHRHQPTIPRTRPACDTRWVFSIARCATTRRPNWLHGIHARSIVPGTIGADRCQWSLPEELAIPRVSIETSDGDALEQSPWLSCRSDLGSGAFDRSAARSSTSIARRGLQRPADRAATDVALDLMSIADDSDSRDKARDLRWTLPAILHRVSW